MTALHSANLASTRENITVGISPQVNTAIIIQIIVYYIYICFISERRLRSHFSL